MMLSARTAAALVLLFQISCSSDDAQEGCDIPCPEGQWCHEETGLCVSGSATSVEHANLSPVFDARMVSGLWQAAVYDRLGGRFLYGLQAEDGSFTWEPVANGDIDPTVVPQMVLLMQDKAPWLLLEQSPGVVSVATRATAGWTVTSLLDLDGRLSHLHASADKEFGIHICAGLEDGSVVHASSLDNPPFQPVTLHGLQGLATLRAPCIAAVMAGRTTVLSAGHPKGLLSTTWTAEEGWTSTLLDDEARVVSMAHLVVEAGLVIAYIDAVDGGLKYASSSSGKVNIQVADQGVVDPELPQLGPAALRMASFPQVSQPHMAYYHHGQQALKLMELQENNAWFTVDEFPDDHMVFPALAVTAAGDPALLSIRFSPAGTLNLGSFTAYPPEP